MTQFLSVPCKKGFEINMAAILSSYVKDTYGDEQCTNHTAAFTEFNNMRNRMLSKLFDKHESALSVLTKYHDQFVALETKIPMEENNVRIDFKWEDAFSKESLFGKKTTLKIASGAYERICVLFNIASLYSQVADSQNLNDESGLKTAAKYYQQAAGIYAYLKVAVPGIIQRDPTVDLNSDTLNTLGALMLAQAQELIHMKAVRDQMKDVMVAKITQQVADLYADALKLMQLNSVKSVWPKDWIPLVAGKQAGYHGLAEYYQGKACGSNQAFGEMIGRLRKATELLKTSSSRAGQKFMFRTEQDRIRRDLETVEKENNLIYHETIHESASLSLIAKAVIAKELPLENPINNNFHDLFGKIVPLAMHSAILFLENKRRELIGAEIYRLKEATEVLNGVMTSLSLPGAVEESRGDQLPEVLLVKSAAVRSAGGIDKIDNLINVLPDLLQRNTEILNEAINMLDEEETSDSKLKDQFKDRWNRTPSGKLTEVWRNESKKFKTLLEQARVADETIRSTYQQHAANWRVVSKPEAELKQSLPRTTGGSADTDTEGSESLKSELRVLCREVDSVKAARTDFVAEVQAMDPSSLNAAFTKAMSENSELSQEEFVNSRLTELLQPLRERVRESLQEQDSLLSRIQEKATRFAGGSGSGQMSSRANIVSGLMLAADKFVELTANLEESQKFYGDLTEIFIKFQNKVKDFCFARKTEKEELMKDLQSSMTKERTEHRQQPSAAPTATANAASTYQATSTGTEQSGPNQKPIYQGLGLLNQPPQRPAPTYQPPGIQTQASNAPQMNPHQQQGPSPNMPYAPNPYQMPQPYMPGVPQMYMPPPMGGYMPPGGMMGYPPSQPPYQQQPPYGQQQPPQQQQPYYPGYNPYYPR